MHSPATKLSVHFTYALLFLGTVHEPKHTRGSVQLCGTGECFLPLTVETICLHSELTGMSNWRGKDVATLLLAGLLWYWLFFSSHSHAWGKAHDLYCRQRQKRGAGVDRLNLAILTDRIPRKPFKVTSPTKVPYSLKSQQRTKDKSCANYCICLSLGSIFYDINDGGKKGFYFIWEFFDIRERVVLAVVWK